MTIAPSTSPNDRRADGAPAPEPHVIVLFGAFGDLSRRKLLPGLFRLARTGLMPDGYRIIGTSRSERSDEDLRELARDAVGSECAASEAFEHFAACLSSAAFKAEDPDALAQAVERAEDELGGRARRLHYLSVPPGAAGPVVRALGASGLASRARVVLEKPFGTDLETSRELNALVDEVFSEEAVFRIDHFLGREAVQNLIALRFANGMFEPIWNRDHIDHVQLDVPETIGVDSRTGFYEETGAYRDMVVTHLFHLLGFVAMEPPTSLQANALGEESRKVFRAMEPVNPQDVVRGQYEGYRDEAGVPDDSDVETFVAARVTIENWRWTGVPFYLRTGKRMAEQHRRLTIAFRKPPRRMFAVTDDLVEDFGPDHLTFDLGESGGISASFLAKVPGPIMRLGQARMEFASDATFGTDEALEPYERLLYDAMTGDRTLFADAEGVERLWTASAPVLADPPPVQAYAPGSWGPPAMDQLIAPRRWRLPI
jgi:glucose-6-phosphate 1-dehydrogenase